MTPDAADRSPLRSLAQISILFAIASLLATIIALMRLPNAVPAGDEILIAAGTAVIVSAFVFGVMITMKSSRARPIGFVAVAAAVIAAGLFGLLAVVAPESAWLFGGWATALIVYGALASHRLVRWPAGDGWDRPRSHASVFISYRRQDSHETVGRIHDYLRQAFEEERIFLDVESEAAGEDYRAAIARALTRTDVVLAVIGPRWLSAADHDGHHRLDDPHDMVRMELETALQQNVRIVPVLVEGAAMPAAGDVPASIQPVCYRAALPVRPDPDFKHDMYALMNALAEGDVPVAGRRPAFT
jgi:hypothetical protein